MLVPAKEGIVGEVFDDPTGILRREPTEGRFLVKEVGDETAAHAELHFAEGVPVQVPLQRLRHEPFGLQLVGFQKVLHGGQVAALRAGGLRKVGFLNIDKPVAHQHLRLSELHLPYHRHLVGEVLEAVGQVVVACAGAPRRIVVPRCPFGGVVRDGWFRVEGDGVGRGLADAQFTHHIGSGSQSQSAILLVSIEDYFISHAAKMRAWLGGGKDGGGGMEGWRLGGMLGDDLHAVEFP